MRVIKHKTLKEYFEEHPETEGALESWYHEVKKENWKNPEDVRAKYPKARTIPGNRIVFNILRNKYRLIVKVGISVRSCIYPFYRYSQGVQQD